MVGGFDGYFIFKYLYHYTKDPKLVDLMLDKNNKFIKITLSESYKSKGKINRRELFSFKDSMILLGGVRLNTLCNIYGVESKLCEYKPIWNTLDMFKDENKEIYQEWLSYAEQDSKCLYEAIVKAPPPLRGGNLR